MKIRSLIAVALIPQILIVNFLRNNPSFIDDYYVGIIFNNLIKINSFLRFSLDEQINLTST